MTVSIHMTLEIMRTSWYMIDYKLGERYFYMKNWIISPPRIVCILTRIVLLVIVNIINNILTRFFSEVHLVVYNSMTTYSVYFLSMDYMGYHTYTQFVEFRSHY